MKYLLIALLWSGYCVQHSYLISVGFTNRLTRLLKNYYAFYRVLYILISCVLIIPLINLTSQLDNRVILNYTFPLSVLRYALLSGSLLIFLWAFFFDYDFLSFFGVRQILTFRTEKTVSLSDRVKKNGLLGIIRHPMYFALLIFLWCQTFRVADIVVNAVLTIYIIIGTRLEEKKLVLQFGYSYFKYQQEVPMLIPFTKTKVK
jgi:methanethiol S-methyltransferase